MSKIFFNNVEIWNKNRLPKETEVRGLFKKYAPSQVENLLAEEAISVGLDVNAKEGYFHVVLHRDALEAMRIRK